MSTLKKQYLKTFILNNKGKNSKTLRKVLLRMFHYECYKTYTIMKIIKYFSSQVFIEHKLIKQLFI